MKFFSLRTGQQVGNYTVDSIKVWGDGSRTIVFSFPMFDGRISQRIHTRKRDCDLRSVLGLGV